MEKETIYKEMYLHLFNAVTDALSRFGDGDAEEGCAILRAAQEKCETQYIEGGEA